MADPDPTLRDVLTELRAVGEKLETLTRDVADVRHDVADLRHHVADLRHDVADLRHHVADHGAKLEALTGEVETLGRDTRELKAELLTELPPAVVAAVDRTLGERVRNLERDVAELKR